MLHVLGGEKKEDPILFLFLILPKLVSISYVKLEIVVRSWTSIINCSNSKYCYIHMGKGIMPSVDLSRSGQSNFL